MHWNIKHKISSTSQSARRQEILNSILNNRGITSKQSQKSFYHPPHPNTIKLSDIKLNEKSIQSAITLIDDLITSQRLIVIYGDYDADGISATAILYLCLKQLGANVHPFIPHREKHGYGLSIEALEEIIKDLKPSLIITVDNGIVAHNSAHFLNSKDIPLIITDHHQPGATLPQAHAVIHTQEIAGSGVAWFLTRELSAYYHKKTGKLAFDTDQTLDLLVIGTIADLLPLKGVNRAIAFHGLDALTKSARPGILALKKLANIPPNTQMSTYHIGFVIGPRINAMGRLSHSIDALKLLCTSNHQTAAKLATLLDDTNRDRQDLTYQMVEVALSQIGPEDHQAKILIIDHQDFHEGIVGLIAGKLTEKYYKPTIIINRGKNLSKASARSVSGINITELIATQKHLLESYGGHPGASGFSIQTKHIQEFKTGLALLASQKISSHQLTPSLDIDCQLELSDIGIELYQELEKFAPFGIDNPRPVLATTAQITDVKLLGRDQSHLKLRIISPDSLLASPKTFEAIGFSMADHFATLSNRTTAMLAFTLNQNHFRGNSTLQLVLKDIRYQSQS